jgi:hypothetical protein
MMGHDDKKEWFNIATNYTTNQSQEEPTDCIKQFLLAFMEDGASLDIKEWS